MKLLHAIWALAVVSGLGCGSDAARTSSDGSDAAAGGTDASGGSDAATRDGGAVDASVKDSSAGGSDSAAADASATDGSSSADSSSTDASLVVRDPNADGPFAYAERDATTTVASTGDSVAIHVAYPTTAGTYPVVVFGHGLQLAPSQYYSYVKRLASFGYVALTVDFPGSIIGTNNPNEAKDMIAGIDWAKNDAMLGPIVDAANVAMSGHSLGGKVALLAATMDARVKASFVLDPVDGGGPNGCNAPACVTVATLMPALHIPTGFVGETTDAMGGFMPCAPAASNFTTFYSRTNSPSVQITAAGANHMSFLDDVGSCGLTCSFCQMATATNAQVTAMTRALMVAFYERHLRGNIAYDAYITGAQAQARYVATQQATITSK